jgi:hypothetical protein
LRGEMRWEEGIRKGGEEVARGRIVGSGRLYYTLGNGAWCIWILAWMGIMLLVLVVIQAARRINFERSRRRSMPDTPAIHEPQSNPEHGILNRSVSLKPLPMHIYIFLAQDIILWRWKSTLCSWTPRSWNMPLAIRAIRSSDWARSDTDGTRTKRRCWRFWSSLGLWVSVTF